MPLSDLSLEELTELAGTLEQIRDAGAMLAAYGLHPTFDLTPGHTATISLPFSMPAIGEPDFPYPSRLVTMTGPWSDPTPSTEAIAQSRARLETDDDFLGRITVKTPSPEAAPDLTQSGEAAPARAEPEETPPAVEGPAGGTLSAKPSRTGGASAPPPAAAEASPPPQAEAPPPVAKVESGGGRAMPAATSPAATHERTFTRGPDWTAEEDARLIDLVVKAVGLGATKKAAMIAAAQELGRPDQATQFRCHHRLKTRIDAALTAAAMAQAQTEIPASPAPANATDGPTASGGADAVGGHSPAAVQDEPDMEPGQAEAETLVRAAASIEGQLAEANPEEVAPPALHGLDLRLWQYLRRNRPRWPLTIGTDLDLVEALGRGDKLPMIAVDLGIDANKLKDRFQVLTAMILDAKDRPTIDGLQRLVKMLRRIVADAAPTKAA